MESSNKSESEIIEEELDEMVLNAGTKNEVVSLMLRAFVYSATEGGFAEMGDAQLSALREFSSLQAHYEELVLQEAANKEGIYLKNASTREKRCFLANLVLEAVNANELGPVLKTVGKQLSRIDLVEMSKEFAKITGETWSDYRDGFSSHQELPKEMLFNAKAQMN